MITVQFTNGFGNNLFQYNAARLLAEFHKKPLYVIPPDPEYYGIEELRKVGIDFELFDESVMTGPAVVVDEQNYRSCFREEHGQLNFILHGYFEDYTLFNEQLDFIKSWYVKVEKRQTKDLVIHFRAGDRLLYKNEFYMKPTIQEYIDAIENFDFDELHIVTDMPNWEHITEEELGRMKFHVDIPEDKRPPAHLSVEYFNSFVDGLKKYNPHVEQRSVSDDFNFIRSFGNILFQHGTLGWWAACLSEAEKVGVYGPWRPWKGEANKNLSQIPLNGWFRWE